MEQRFNKALERLESNNGDSGTILAVSGGVDSVVLTHLYHLRGKSFTIAHCNFQLRGVESQKDEEFVLELGSRLGAEVLIKKFDTSLYAKVNGVSTQMAARALRYNWFGELGEDRNSRIATAHHANDVTETLLFNLSKGTGLAGFHGISEKGDRLIRPLLWATKDEIYNFALEKKFAWREDQSNESEKYMRNIIRRKVVPELERINPGFVLSSLRTTTRIKEAEDFLNYCINRLDVFEKRQGDIFFKKSIIEALPGRVAVLYNLLSKYEFNYDQVNSVDKSWSSTGACFYSRDWILNIDREYLIVSKKKEEQNGRLIQKSDYRIGLETANLKVTIIAVRGYEIIDDNNLAALDLAKLSFPLSLRHWQEGDYFVPLGMSGKKKVSDFLIDIKMSVAEKKRQLVLISNDQIVWLVGQRIAEWVKITNETEQVYQVKIETS